MGFCSRLGARGEPQYLETFRADADPGSELSHLGLAPPRDRDLGRVGPGQRWILEAGLRVGGPGTPPFWRAEGALYGTELGSVTFKRISFFCFPIKHSTHTDSLDLGNSDLGPLR